MLLPCGIFKYFFSTITQEAKHIPKSKMFKVVEVGARDGLQNEKQIIPAKDKIDFINKLSHCGFQVATSFVSPRWIPQMADHQEVIQKITKCPGVSYPVLVPNLVGLHNALKSECVKEIAVFGAASNSFSRKNTNASIEESLKNLQDVTTVALKEGLRVRGYVSCVIGCPYEGKVDSAVVAKVAETLLEAGCYEVSLGDTIGVGSAGSVASMLEVVLKSIPAEKLAVHFHDTYGQALVNVIVAIEKGIRVADSSIAGLGGCPYAMGATGNVATEDLVYMLHDMGFYTGINLSKLIETSTWICSKMGRPNASRVAKALMTKQLDSKDFH
ncbi:putative hydroxymethylglutaryl-CoA lyase [Dictyocaulus viviparus]|uniref:hydroxymethylglutaryl-CoA lyase n=1 Tax=Dictyocaulus viviparus TaxID=29172 RepID=A0A0D8XKF4_DICVI|nr:putative hydroxymethylglutaryl-CoA lyase [Dictyocaulus viviparus]